MGGTADRQSWTAAASVGQSGGMESSPLDGLAAAQGHGLRELLVLAGEEARRLGHHYVGTGHVAVAAIQMSAEESSVVDARSRLEGLLGRGSAQADDPLQATPRLIQLVSECRAASETDDADASHVLSAIRPGWSRPWHRRSWRSNRSHVPEVPFAIEPPQGRLP